jgi:hypothetical protein
MITLVLLAIVVAVIATVMIASQRSKADTEGRVEAQQSGRAVSDLITQDLRTAGYEVDSDASPPQLPFAYVDSTEIIMNSNQTPFPDTLGTRQDPRAVNPASTPLPPRITGAYLPAMTYSTGAEMIRYTLDLNDDGVVDAGDQAAPLASEAQRTANPNDYVLGRAVYGLISGGTNGGSMEKVGLVRGPAAGVPNMFTVYLGTNPLPWNWGNGPIPANRLREISRITVRVTTEGRRARKDGTYPRATLTTEVNSLRNSPGATGTLYTASGFVFSDVNRNGTRDTGEPGVAGALLRLGTTSVVQTSTSGYYALQGAPAQYILRQTPPEGFGAFSADSLAIDFVSSPVDVTHSFADTVMTGGWVSDTCFIDVNSNSVLDAGDERVDRVTLTAGGKSKLTGGDGSASFFLPVGTQTINATPPDSLMVVSTNPVSVNVTNGSNLVVYTRLIKGGTGKVTGYVYLDTNKNGVKDTGENGIMNAWVGVSKNTGAELLGYTTTNSSGYYEIVVSNNMPAATTPYEVSVIPPTSFYPTASTTISPIWVAVGAVLTNKNFGMSNYTMISLTADRVLCLGVANLLEKDWTGSDNNWDTKGSWDADLILGSEYISAPNISVWFNQMGGSGAMFATPSTPTGYQRNAQSAALSIATGSIDNVVPTEREDVVTGLARKPSGNIAVWLTQNSPTANIGFIGSAATSLPILYQTQDAGDVNQVLLHDCAGTTALDLIVGTKNTTNTGTIEVWTGSGTGTFFRDETYPPNGSLGVLGEVKAMLLVDVTADGNKDLVVGTKTGDGQGKIHVLGFNTRTGGNRYRVINSYDVVGEVTSLATTFVDADLLPDLVVGTRITSITGNVQYWRGNGGGSFVLAGAFTAPGPVLSLAIADMGGSSKQDIVFGFRTDEALFTGGVRILYLDLGTLPAGAVDPADGTQNYMTPSLAVANFNYRINNTTPGPYYSDLAVAMKPTAATGNLLIFVR